MPVLQVGRVGLVWTTTWHTSGAGCVRGKEEVEEAVEDLLAGKVPPEIEEAK
jgi:hypothetical protein